MDIQPFLMSVRQWHICVNIFQTKGHCLQAIKWAARKAFEVNINHCKMNHCDTMKATVKLAWAIEGDPSRRYFIIFYQGWISGEFRVFCWNKSSRRKVWVLFSEGELTELPGYSPIIFKKLNMKHERPTTTFFNGKYSALFYFCFV